MEATTIFSRGVKKIVILVILSVLLGSGQVWLWKTVGRAVQSWHASRSQDAQLRLLKERLRVLEEAADGETALREQLSLVAPGTTQTPVLIDRLERMADELGLTIQVRTISTGQAGPVTPLFVQLDVSGNPLALARYVETIEHLPELVVVQSLSLVPLQSVGAPLGQSALYTMNMTVVFYTQATHSNAPPRLTPTPSP